MADDNDNRPKEQGRGQQNQVSERGNGGQQGGESHQSGHIDKGRQGGQKPDTRPTGDYGVAAGLAYDDQTMRSRLPPASRKLSKMSARYLPRQLSCAMRVTFLPRKKSIY